MWAHTRDVHIAVVGPDQGAEDYKMAMTGQYRNIMERQVNEGTRQIMMEAYQAKNTLQVFNSKIDFVQPLRTQLTTTTKSVNRTPGNLDKYQNTPLPTSQNRDKSKNDRQTEQRRIAKGRRRLNRTQTNHNTFKPTEHSTPQKGINENKTNPNISPIKHVRFQLLMNSMDGQELSL